MPPILARAQEPSTWAALAALLAGLGVQLPAGLWQTITYAGMAIAGAAGILLRETTKPPA